MTLGHGLAKKAWSFTGSNGARARKVKLEMPHSSVSYHL
jgi:hypothetical protein